MLLEQNFTLRTVRLALVEEFAASHNQTCLVKFLGIDGSALSEAAKKAVTLPLSTGGLGIQNTTRAFLAAQWASWADVLEMIRKRHPGVAAEIITALDQGTVLRQLQLSGIPRSGWKRQAKLGGVGAGRKTESTKPRGGDCGHSGKPRMAAASISGVGEEQSRRIAAPTHGTRTSSDVVPRRPPVSQRVGTRFDSQPSSCAASVFLCLLLLAVADVAVSWTSLAIIAAACATVECWGGVGLHWSQPPQGFAERQGEE